jgi:MFS family permease
MIHTGTHLYVLYESYGFNVASLYALGFVTGAVTTPITGPLIDKFGRKRSAMLYCILEMGINLLEQYPFLSGLLVSRMVGGITTNLLSSVFETWLDTEFRNRRISINSAATSSATTNTTTCTTTTTIDDDDTTTTTASASVTSEWSKGTIFTDGNDDDAEEQEEDDEDTIAKDEYELIMRDSVIVSNLASIASGYLAHLLAEKYGPVGPFQGAVTCTGIALFAVCLLWTENYGVSSVSSASSSYEKNKEAEGEDDYGNREDRSYEQKQPPPSSKSIREYIVDAMATFRSDSKILTIGIIQGLSAGSLQIFIFLWSPTLQKFASSGVGGKQIAPFPIFSWAMDGSGEPAYGLIFGAFMAAGVTGGLCAPYFRQAVSFLFSSPNNKNGPSALQTIHVEAEGINVRPMILEFLVGINYIIAAILLLIPCILPATSPESFSIALASFLTYEFLVGVTMPNEGVIRSIYLPSDGRATMMMVPRMVVNLAVSLGVLLTKCMA